MNDVLADETVAVVVVTYNSGALLADLVASLPRGLHGLQWHLVVVDNASTDDSERRARELAPDAIVVQTGRNAGYAAGINAGVAAAPPHTAVLVLNPDVRLEEGCVGELLRALRRPGVGIAVPRLVDGDGELILTQRREPSILRAIADAVIGAERAGRIATLGEVISDRAAYEREGAVDWAEGSTVLVSRECWQRCGPWDETFFLYSEETDFALRSRDAGLGVSYTPTAHAVHLEGGSGQNPELWAILSVNRVRLFGRRHSGVATTVYWLSLVLREASRALLGRRTSRAAVRALCSPRRLRSQPSAADLVPSSEPTQAVI